MATKPQIDPKSQSKSQSKIQFYLYDHQSKNYFQIRDGLICGRAEGDLIFSSDSLMSRRHCCFHITGNEIYIEDFDSTNRTKVNSVPIQSGRRRRIRLNDVIELGSQRWILTNQNRHVPSNVKDLTERRQVHRAHRKKDGGLTSFVTGAHDYTPILVSRMQHRKLSIQKTFRNHHQAFRIFCFSTLFLLGWLLVVVIFQRSGILEPGLPHPAANFHFKLSIVSGASLVLSVFLNYFLKTYLRISRPATIALYNIACFILVVSLIITLADYTRLVQDTKDNLIKATQDQKRVR